MKFDIKEELIRCSDVLAEVEEVLREKDNDNRRYNVSAVNDRPKVVKQKGEQTDERAFQATSCPYSIFNTRSAT